MQLTNEWYYFTGVLDGPTCEKIVQLWSRDSTEARVQRDKDISREESGTGRKKNKGLDETLRKSDVIWLDKKWIYDLIAPYMRSANHEAGWQFEITNVEKAQLTRYEGGGFYTWHKDGQRDHLSAFSGAKSDALYGNVRKLSMGVLLNDDFEGGEFEFAHYEGGEFSVAKPEFEKPGSIIVFPSFMEHRVAPVTRGVRYSLVTWFLGPPFK